MDALLIPFPRIDPVIVHIWGPIAIRWYGLAYMLGFLGGYWLLRREARSERLPVPPRAIGDLLFALVLGVVVGGRLGYVLFYKPLHYLAEPAEIPRLWDGGMAFHGGLLGVIVAIVLFARRHSIPWTKMSDACAVATPIGLFFGRLANFINGELWGRTTDVPWAMIFPGDETGQPRHPSQLYEAFGEGLVLFLVMLWVRRRSRRDGVVSAVFLVGYAVARFVVEFFREPDEHLGTVLGPFSMGQLLSAGMLVAGAGWLWSMRTSR